MLFLYTFAYFTKEVKPIFLLQRVYRKFTQDTNPISMIRKNVLSGKYGGVFYGFAWTQNIIKEIKK